MAPPMLPGRYVGATAYGWYDSRPSPDGVDPRVRHRMKIYLAGPLFTLAERRFNLGLRNALIGIGRADKIAYDIYLPQEGEVDSQTRIQAGTEVAASETDIFERDVRAIDDAEVVIANMDGTDPDSGTCWECGYAYKKKRIVLFRTDFRGSGNAGGSRYNLMLTRSADRVIDMPWRSEADESALGRLAREIHQAIQGRDEAAG